MSSMLSSNSMPEAGLPPEAGAWLAEHPDADAAGLEEAWCLADHAQPPDAAFMPDPGRVEAMRARVVAVAAGTPQPGSHVLLTLIRRMPHAWAVAASVVVLVAVGAWLFLRPVSHQAPLGETLTATLPDGSTVELNSGARLVYARPFGRSVRLTGEAFFDVQSDPQKPFTVETFNAAVVVLGTRFNVRAWPDDPTQETVVVLEEGRVRVEALGKPEYSTLLEPGHMSRIVGDDASPSPPAPASVEQMLAWRQGGFYFDDYPVAVILAEVGRRFGVAIAMPEALTQRRLTLYLQRAESVDTVLDLLCRVSECRYRAMPGGYEVLEKNVE